MKLKNLLSLSGALFTGVSMMAQAPAESEDVMLQGFYWDSQKMTGWTLLQEKAAEIGEDFTCIWLPPSASPEGGSPTVGGNNVGYHPRQWNDQNSCWGTSDDLKSLISTLHDNGVKVIADIVVNHRAGDNDWGNFTRDNFGEYGDYQLTAEHICKNDEMNTDPSSGSWYGKATGANDTGENWGGARDLDHTSEYVQADCKAYMNWLKGEYGYDGWRYDFCKGFDGKYVGVYNDATEPYISVGEYWDGSYDKVGAWITATGKKSMAFDFPMKYAALNDGLAKGNYAGMSWIEDNTTWRPSGMIHHHDYNRYAITFVDNHDSYRDGNKYTGNVAQANAFILSAPGIPCVFWMHWVNTSSGPQIKKMIAARRLAGIHSQSDVTVTQRGTYYECVSVGHRGSLICRIGGTAPKDVPEGYYLACSGSGWQYFLSEGLLGIETPAEVDEAYIGVEGRVLTVSSASVLTVSVTGLDGRVYLTEQSSELSRELPAGIYVVRAGYTVRKVMVQ